jgi:hypothetical protein
VLDPRKFEGFCVYLAAMSRIGMAFSCFFRLLFGGKLPADAVKFLPAGALPAPTLSAAPKPGPEKVAVVDSVEKPKPAVANTAAHHRDGALAMLALMQREGRLVDFLREPLDGFSDADIGATARDIHRGCRKVLEQHLTLEAVMPGNEEDRVSVPKGFDPTEIRLIGEAKGEPPYRGTLRHHGWRVTDARLPALVEGVDRTVVAPAEVEVSS